MDIIFEMQKTKINPEIAANKYKAGFPNSQSHISTFPLKKQIIMLIIKATKTHNMLIRFEMWTMNLDNSLPTFKKENANKTLKTSTIM